MQLLPALDGRTLRNVRTPHVEWLIGGQLAWRVACRADGMVATNSFRDLDVWQEAMTLVEEIYVLSMSFPADERFGLTSQIRRAAISIPSNIAEGGRRKHRKVHLHHLDIALGSQAEVDVQLEIATRLHYCSPNDVRSVQDRIDRVGRMLNGLIDSLQPQAENWNH